nr:hypothetical protein Itr_chr02CG06960 [Ipomoea trifida]
MVERLERMFVKVTRGVTRAMGRGVECVRGSHREPNGGEYGRVGCGGAWGFGSGVETPVGDGHAAGCGNASGVDGVNVRADDWIVNVTAQAMLLLFQPAATRLRWLRRPAPRRQ